MNTTQQERSAGKPKQKHQPTRAALVGTHAGNASATKRGPGRYHSDGHEKATPHKDKGAPRGFVLHKNAQANAARALKRDLGHRQIKRARMAPLRAARIAARSA